jgi:hypothetical protein
VDDVIELESVFTGRGLLLAPAVTLTKVFIRTSTNFDDAAAVSYTFEIEVDLPHDASLLLTGEGGFGDSDSNSELAHISVESALTSSFFILPSVEILPTCEVSLDLKAVVDTTDFAMNRTEWLVSDTAWEECGAVLHLPGDDSTITTLTSGKVDVLTSEYEVSVNAKFDNLYTALSVMLNSTSFALPEALEGVTIDDTVDATIELNSKADTMKLAVTVDVDDVEEIKNAVDAIGLGFVPDFLHMSCEIETSLSKPAWNATSVKFLISAEGFQLGPFTVDLFEFELDRNHDGSELVLKASSIIVLLEQRFRLDGVTSIDEAQTTQDLQVKFMANEDKKLYLFYDKVHILDGSLDITLVKEAEEDAEFEVEDAVFMGKARIHYTSSLTSDTTVTLDFTPNLLNYELTVESMSVVDIFTFLPSYPGTEYERLTFALFIR